MRLFGWQEGEFFTGATTYKCMVLAIPTHPYTYNTETEPASEHIKNLGMGNASSLKCRQQKSRKGIESGIDPHDCNGNYEVALSKVTKQACHDNHDRTNNTIQTVP